MTVHYLSPDEEAHHVMAMQILAEETGLTFDIVKQTYEQQLDRLLADAKLRDYLPVLAARRTRESFLGAGVYTRTLGLNTERGAKWAR